MRGAFQGDHLRLLVYCTQEEGYQDEYNLEEVHITPADYIRRESVGNFRKAWEGLPSESEVSRECANVTAQCDAGMPCHARDRRGPGAASIAMVVGVVE